MEQIKTLQQAIQHFGDPENCRKFMVFLRWPDGKIKCPYCDGEKVTWLAKAKVYQCYGDHPKSKFSLKVGTVFEDSAIGLEKWWPAVWLLANSKNGISSYELHRALGVTQKTAWFMLHRIRLAMTTGSFVKIGGTGGGPVEIDEAYFGGQPKNRHLGKRDPGHGKKYLLDEFGDQETLNPDYVPHVCGRATKKTPVFGMLDRETRQVRAHVIPEVKREILMEAILSNIEKGSTIYSDGLSDYKPLRNMEFVHETVNHLNEYVRGQVHTQGIENFWSLLKRGLRGTYIAVEPFHLDRYIGEQIFRYNNRATKDNPLNDGDRFVLAATQIVGKRLTYRELTGKVAETEPF
ncbi:MAG: IS1595 family transposase [Terracidiphilus sp.]|jgi:transposase-like protein